MYQVKHNSTVLDTRIYDDGGRLTQSNYLNGKVTKRTYNNDNTLSLIDFGGVGSTIGDLSYTWDENKNKTSESIAGAMSGYSFTVPTSGYDKEDRLVSFDGAANQPDQSWNLSLVGDWDSVTIDGTTQNRTHGPTHELLTADGQNVVQDAKGNMTTIPANLRKDDTTLNLTWDFDNRMSGADIDGDGTTDVTYQFDALGRRVARSYGNYKRVFVQVGQQTVADYSRTAPASAPAVRRIWGSYIDEPIVRFNPNNARIFYHQNQQYSTYAATNASGQIIERYAYTAYGEQKVLAPSTSPRTKSTYGIRHTYTGREWDSALGLYHYRARMYDPNSGRFCEKDPVGYGGSPWNLYRYCDSSPLARLDPLGTDWSEWPSEYSRDLTPKQIQKMINKETDPVEKAKLRKMKKIKQQMAKRISKKVKNKGRRSRRGCRGGSACKGLLTKILLFECEAACAFAYDRCLDRSLTVYETCLRDAMHMNEPTHSNQVALCDRISTLDFIDCGGSYVACGLACLVGHDMAERAGER